MRMTYYLPSVQPLRETGPFFTFFLEIMRLSKESNRLALWRHAHDGIRGSKWYTIYRPHALLLLLL